MSAQNTAGITQTGTILDKIVARKVEEVEQLEIKSGTYKARPPRDFLAALRRDTIALIAEIKKASPSKGILVENFDPVGLAADYVQGGAAAISVLTDQDFFQGKVDDLTAVWESQSIPLLRKDFTIDRKQVIEGLLAGANAILLITAILDDALLYDLFMYVKHWSMTPLVEVHTEGEMERALKLNPPLIGINNRDLHTFKVDLAVTERLAAMVPADVTLVAESGIFTVEDVQRVAAAGVDAILVGESIVKSPDVGAQVRMLSSVPRKNRS